MKFKIKNLGVLSQAELSLSDVTVITGDNNTGKTYATYALWGLARCFQDYPENAPFGAKVKLLHGKDLSPVVAEADAKGRGTIELAKVIDIARASARHVCGLFSESLSRFFKSEEKRFEGAELDFEVGEWTIPSDAVLQRRIGEYLIEREAGDNHVHITRAESPSGPEDERPSLAQHITLMVCGWVYSHNMPAAHIITSERSGITLFQRELDIRKNELANIFQNLGRKKITPMDILNSMSSRYAQPIQENIDVARDFSTLMKQKSELAAGHPELLAAFAHLAGGAYKTGGADGEMQYIPEAGLNGRKAKSLPVYLASSSVRALSFLSLYLHHLAKKGDLLVIDEPEMNLHPGRQRKLARFLSMLANAGIRVLVTTHSDHIVREFHHLIHLSSVETGRQPLLKKLQYYESEILRPAQVRLYIAEPGRKGGTLRLIETAADGFAETTFDHVISEMNRVADAILIHKEENP